MKKLLTMASLLVVASLMLTACGGGGSTATDLLGAIKERGYILISTDPNYEPQSFLNTEGSRPSDTKCPSDALTTAEMQGFDVDVAIAVGDALGVETCFATVLTTSKSNFWLRSCVWVLIRFCFTNRVRATTCGRTGWAGMWARVLAFCSTDSNR